MLARIIGLFITTYLLLVTLAIPAFAQTYPQISATDNINNTQPLPANIPPTSPIYTDLLLHNMFHSVSCIIAGSSVIGQPCLTYQSQKDSQGMLQTVPVLSKTNLSGGAIGGIGSFIGALYNNPPVRTSEYLASIGKDLGLTKEAKAQEISGSGNEVLKPIISLWQISRNISYLVMIVIFVIIGLMVMFRNRINPQTVITAQAALPGLILGLILITFSYFFAGLISDTAFVGTNIVGGYFAAVRGDSQNLLQELIDQKANALTIYSKYVGIIDSGKATAGVTEIWTNLEGWVQNWLRLIGTGIVAQFVMPFGGLAGGVGQIFSTFIAGVITNASPEGIVGQVLGLMAMIILIYSMLRLVMRLVSAYLNIILLTITAPFQFLAASLPGRQGLATSWMLNMLSHSLAFPAVLAVLYFVAFLLGKPSGPLRVDAGHMVTNDSLIPIASAADVNFVDTATFPLFGGMGLELIKLLLAFGALTALPAVPDVINRTIGKVGQAGQLLGQEASKGIAGGRGYYGQSSGILPGFSKEIGNMRDTTGYQPNAAGTGWESVTASSATDLDTAYKAGVRPGRWSVMKTGVSNLRGKI